MRYIIPLIITVVGGIALMGLSSVSPSEPLNVAAAKPEVTLGVDILRLTQVVDVDTSVNTTTEIIVAPTLSLDSEVIPTFATFDPTTNLLRLTPTKSDNGNHYIRFSDSETNSIIYSIDITRSQVDWSALRASLESYLGEYSSSYGIYIYDLNREQEFGINADVEFPPASIAKLTVAALVLRDVDAGRYTLDTVFPIADEYKFSYLDDLGSLEVGFPVTLDTYIHKLIADSNNTAWYHLLAFLGGHQTVNFRTTTELEANPFFLDPHAATAKQVGELLRDIYTTKLLTAESRDYLLNIMSNALPWNREGLGLGLPSSIQFANKIGFLWTDADLNFVDSAIVWGNNTDYVVVVLDRNVDWESGKYALMEISRLVYAALDV